MAAALSVAVVVAGARRAALGGGGLVVRARPARRRLLVPAQPGRRRQPAARRSRASGRSRCPTPSACRAAGPTSTSPTTRPTPASGASTSAPACTTPSAALWPLVVWRRSGRGASALCSAAATASCAGSAASPCSACSPTSSRRSAPPAPRASRTASGSTSATSSRPCSPASPCCRCRAAFDDRQAPVGAAGALLVVVLVLTDRSDAVAARPRRALRHRCSRCSWSSFPPALLLRARRGACRAASSRAGFAALALAVVAIGYPLQRDYLDDRFPTTVPADERSPAWTSTPPTAGRADVEDARIGLAGTTAGFLSYGFYGTDLSNQVRYLGEEGPHGAFNAIPTCAALPRRRQRRRPRLPGHRPLPQLPPPRRPGPLARGALAARRAGGAGRSCAAARSPSGRSTASSTRRLRPAPTRRCAEPDTPTRLTPA